MIATLLPVLLPFLGDILTRLLGDPNKAKELELAVIKWAAEQDKGQLEVNREEAKHASLFVAGWRPFVGWGCGIAVIYEFGGRQVLNWAGEVIAWSALGIAPMLGLDVTAKLAAFPVLPSIGRTDGVLWELLFGLLGLGGLRTFEKVKGVAGVVSVGGTSPTVNLGNALKGAR